MYTAQRATDDWVGVGHLRAHWNPLPRWLSLSLNTAMAFLILLYSLDMFDSLVSSASGDAGALGREATWACLSVGVTCWAILHYRTVLNLFRQSIFYLLIVLLALLSATWSQNFGYTLYHAITLCFTYLFGAFIAVVCTRSQQLRLACAALLISEFLSYAVQILAPGLVPGRSDPGLWTGVWAHKNALAGVMVPAVVAFLCFPQSGLQTKVVRSFGIVGATGLIVLSHSATGLLVLIVLLLGYVVLRQVARGGKTLIVTLLISTALIGTLLILAVTHQAAIFYLVGKDSNLTGRVSIWASSNISIAKQPWLGYGYESFWHVSNESITARGFIPNHYDAPHAHNGSLETRLQLGWIGLAFVIANFTTIFLLALRTYRRTKMREDLWPAMLTLYFAFYSVSEAPFLEANSFTWILFTAAVFSFSRKALPEAGIYAEVVRSAP